jgi:hypothetical protein
MPSKSPEQRRFMSAVAHNPAFAKKVGVPTAVGKEFARADRGKGYSTQAMVNRPNTAHGKLDMPFYSVKTKAQGGSVMKESKAMVGKEVAFMKKKGAPKSMIKHEMAEAKYAGGGGVYRKAADGVAQRGKTKGKMLRKGGRVC